MEFLQGREEVKELFASIEKEIENYFNSLQGLDNLARYKHGKLTVAALTFLVPTGATQLSKLGKLKKVLQTIKGFTKSQMDEFLPKFCRFMDEGLVNVVGRVSWNGYENIFKANTDEILTATNRIKNYRLNSTSGGNYAYLEGTVNNTIVDNKFWRSGTVQEGEPQIFNAIEVEGANGSAWLRNTDSEYKMLNKLADDLGGTPGSVNSNIIGELKIISENPYCNSCQGIIQQFHEMFPNIKLIIVDGAK